MKKKTEEVIYNLLLTPSSLNLTSFNCLPVGFHFSNRPSKLSTSCPSSFFTTSSSSKPLIAQGRKKGFGFVELPLGSYSWTLSLNTSSFLPMLSFSPIIGMLMPWKLPAVEGRSLLEGMGRDVVSRACWTARAYTAGSS